MVLAITLENSHLYGDVIPSMYRLRYQGFIARQSYDVPTFKDMEYDQYDTPACVYFVWRDEDGIVRGTSRIKPTTRPYMIKDIWPWLVQNIEMPEAHDMWEASRFCIDKTLPVATRRKIHGDLLCAFLEYGLQTGIKGYIGVMSPPIWRAVFFRAGWPIEFVGETKVLSTGESIVAGIMHVSEAIHASVKKTMNVECQVIRNLQTIFEEVA